MCFDRLHRLTFLAKTKKAKMKVDLLIPEKKFFLLVSISIIAFPILSLFRPRGFYSSHLINLSTFLKSLRNLLMFFNLIVLKEELKSFIVLQM